jgi:WD40 repeat protein
MAIIARLLRRWCRLIVPPIIALSCIAAAAEESNPRLVTIACFSPDGTRLLTVSNEGVARIWDVESDSPLFSFSCEGNVTRAVFSPDGTRIVTITDYVPIMWDAASGKKLFSLSNDGVSEVIFSPNGTRILTVGTPVRIWDTASGKQLLSLPKERYCDAAFNPQGTRIVTIKMVGPFVAGHQRRVAELWDAKTGDRLHCPSGQKEDSYAVFSPDGKYLLTNNGWPDGDPALWSAVSGKKLYSFPDCTFYGATFSPNGKQILAGIGDQTVKLWDSATGRELFSFQHQALITSAVFSPDGTRILTASCDNTARLWDVSTGKELFSLPHENCVNEAIFSPDGTRILTLSRGMLGTVSEQIAIVWDARSAKKLFSF